MWHLGTQISGGLGRAGRMVGIDDLKDFFQPKQFSGSMEAAAKTQSQKRRDLSTSIQQMLAPPGWKYSSHPTPFQPSPEQPQRAAREFNSCHFKQSPYPQPEDGRSCSSWRSLCRAKPAGGNRKVLESQRSPHPTISCRWKCRLLMDIT